MVHSFYPTLGFGYCLFIVEQFSHLLQYTRREFNSKVVITILLSICAKGKKNILIQNILYQDILYKNSICRDSTKSPPGQPVACTSVRLL